MAGVIISGLLSRRSCFSSVHATNFWRCSRCSYSTTKKIVDISQQKITLTKLECDIHNSKVPTYEQVQNSPELQEELAKMYEAYAQDPDFHQITIESVKWGLRSLGEEKH